MQYRKSRKIGPSSTVSYIDLEEFLADSLTALFHPPGLSSPKNSGLLPTSKKPVRRLIITIFTSVGTAKLYRVLSTNNDMSTIVDLIETSNRRMQWI